MDRSAGMGALSTLNASSIVVRGLTALLMQCGVDSIACIAGDLLDLAFRDGSSAGCPRSQFAWCYSYPREHLD